jgi:predicted nucleic acid-binding protein
MIVVDVNVLAFYLIEGVRTREARILRQMEPEWAVPPFWLIEFESVLQKYVRFANMPKDEAVDILNQAMDLFSQNEVTPEANAVMQDALNWGVTVYDAQYVSLAKQLGVRCISEDGPVQKKCPEIVLSMAHFFEAASGPHAVRETRTTYRTHVNKQNQWEKLYSLGNTLAQKNNLKASDMNKAIRSVRRQRRAYA